MLHIVEYQSDFRSYFAWHASQHTINFIQSLQELKILTPMRI